MHGHFRSKIYLAALVTALITFITLITPNSDEQFVSRHGSVARVTTIRDRIFDLHHAQLVRGS